MNNSNGEQRSLLRKTVLAKRDSLSNHECVVKSLSAASKIMSLPEMQSAKVVMVYMHFRSEVQTSEVIGQMLDQEKTVTIPHTCPETSHLIAVKITEPDKQVSPGYCGIPEPLPELVENQPCDPKTIDIVIVPGSVFDRCGGRLGYGGGYYDRFLVNEAPDALRVALAFELQVVDRVPVASHDQLMDYLITEENIYDCRRIRNA